MSLIKKNIKNISEYPFTRLRQLLKCTGEDTCFADLSIGQPYHKTPLFVKDLIYKEKDKWKLYPPINGISLIKKSYLNWLKRRFDVSGFFNEENIVPLCGTKEGLFSISMILNLNVICMPNPFYQVYLGPAIANNMRKIFLNTNKKNSFLIDLNKLKKTLSRNPALVYFCSPTNPQGKIADYFYLKELIEIIRYYKSVLIIDECYIDIYYQKKPIGALEVCKKLGNNLNNIIIFHSLSKRSNVAGLRSGFALGDKKIIGYYKKFRSYFAPVMPIPIQVASAELWSDDEHVDSNRKKYKKKMDLANNIFKNYRHYQSPEAGFFIWLKVANGEGFTKKLFKKYSIKVMPGKYLAAGKYKNPGQDYIRIALVHSLEKNKKALSKIAEFLV